MTTANESNSTTVVASIEELGLNKSEVTALKTWLNKTRVDQCSKALDKWLQFGDICTRIKAAKLEGKFKDQVDVFFGYAVPNDDRQYSMKCFDIKVDLVAWYNDTNCMKYNPRTIFTAYQNKDKVALTAEEKKEAKVKADAEQAEKDAKKERTSLEVMQAFTSYIKIQTNASENGNMLLADWQLLQVGLAKELELVKEMVKIESKAAELESHRVAKEIEKDVAA